MLLMGNRCDSNVMRLTTPIKMLTWLTRDEVKEPIVRSTSSTPADLFHQFFPTLTNTTKLTSPLNMYLHCHRFRWFLIIEPTAMSPRYFAATVLVTSLCIFRFAAVSLHRPSLIVGSEFSLMEKSSDSHLPWCPSVLGRPLSRRLSHYDAHDSLRLDF